MAGTIAKLAAVLMAVVTLVDPNLSLATDYYIKPAQVDLIQILAPPPAPKSPAGEADLQGVLDAQHHRTAAEVEMAQADQDRTVLRFATVLGPAFKRANLPFATQFFERAFANDEYVIEPVKSYFDRPRPYLADHKVKPVVDATMTDGSYPSSHSTFAYATAILLADMVPEKAAAIFARADQYAENRVIGGVHYPTDIEAGRISGSVIDNVLLHNPRFKADFARATAEVRQALGLPPLNPLNHAAATIPR
jgi:acid phosphatase (class A)